MIQIGGQGFLGVAFEVTVGTWRAPTKFIPIRSETLEFVGPPIYRTNVRGVADRSGAVKAYQHVEGDIVFEVTSLSLPYMLYASRVTPARTGAGPYTYTFAPSHIAKPTTDITSASTQKTMSIMSMRANNPMGYLGCSVGQMAYTVDTSGLVVATASIRGIAEAPQSTAVASWTNDVPFGPGAVTLSVPSGTPRPDADTFSFTINDNMTEQNRLNGARVPAYNAWGEREVSAGCSIDFDALTDFNAYVNQTQQTLDLLCSNGANDSVDILVNAGITDSYTVGLPDIGSLVRGTVAYHGIYGTTDAYTITVHSVDAMGLT